MSTIWADNLDALYNSDIAVDAVLTAGAGDPLDVRIMDKTEGVVISAANEPDVQTIVPVAVVSMAQLTAGGIDVDTIDGSTLAIDGKAWTVTSHRYKPTPDGETKGELILLLKDGDI